MFAEALSRLPPQPEPTSKVEFQARQDRLTPHNSAMTTFDFPPPHAVHSNDVEYPYRTSSDLIYLTGWTEAETVFVLRCCDGQWISSLFVQPKDTLKEIWEGRRPGVEGALASFAVKEAFGNDELDDRLNEWLTDARRVFHRGGINQSVDRIVETAVRRRDRARQHFGTGPVAVEDPSGMLAELRLRKSSSEIEQMVYAKVAAIVTNWRCDTAALASPNTNCNCHRGILHAGASGWSYPSIVGCGENAHSSLHDQPGRLRRRRSDPHRCTIPGYASDITCSWPISGSFTDAQREIYDIVLAALAAIDAG